MMKYQIKPPTDYKTFYNALAASDMEKDLVDPEYQKAQLKRLLKLCGDTNGLSVLEIGPGKDGAIVHLKNCKRRVAVDVTNIYLDRLPPEIERWNGFAERMPFVSEFDLIICSDVLEHVLKPDALLLSIHKALKPNGMVLIRVPYKEELSKYLDTQWEGCHLRTYDKKSLREDLERNHLKVAGLKYGGYDPVSHNSEKVWNVLSILSNYPKLWDLYQKISRSLPDGIMRILGFRIITVVAICKKRGV